jgi:hypothetical protein
MTKASLARLKKDAMDEKANGVNGGAVAGNRGGGDEDAEFDGVLMEMPSPSAPPRREQYI